MGIHCLFFIFVYRPLSSLSLGLSCAPPLALSLCLILSFIPFALSPSLLRKYRSLISSLTHYSEYKGRHNFSVSIKFTEGIINNLHPVVFASLISFVFYYRFFAIVLSNVHFTYCLNELTDDFYFHFLYFILYSYVFQLFNI